MHWIFWLFQLQRECKEVLMALNTDYLNRCILTLERSYSLIKVAESESIDYEMYRNSLVKSFEMTLEQSGKLLRKVLLEYFPTKKAVDSLTFKDVFRSASRFSLLSEAEVSRWMKYRDNRNNTAHDYGQAFAEDTLVLIDDFILDVKALKKVIDNG